jgi:hypothetical protein
MKIVLRLAIYFTGFFLLVELNSGTLIFDIKNIFNKHPKEITDSTFIIKTIPDDYLQLLNLQGNCCTNDNDNFFFLKTYKSKYRNPISFFVYKRYYYLQVYKIDSSFKSSVKNILSEHYINAQVTYGSFLMDNESEIDYSYNQSAPPKPKSILLKLLGKNNRVVFKNDSVAYYLSTFKNFSIQYNTTVSFDIYGEVKGNGLFSHNLEPLELMFIKRNKNLFLLTMSVFKNFPNEKYPPGLLQDIIKNR